MWPNGLRILATAGPADRLKFVDRIMNTRSKREVVAVTASGVNDDKVLRAADVGLTMVIVHNICAIELIDFAIVAKE